MQTLQEFLPMIRALGNREALRYHNGYRTWRLSYREIYDRITAAVAYLDTQGFSKGDRLLVWSENRPAWVSVFWAAIARVSKSYPSTFAPPPASSSESNKKRKRGYSFLGKR